jgi:hypothetical protein
MRQLSQKLRLRFNLSGNKSSDWLNGKRNPLLVGCVAALSPATADARAVARPHLECWNEAANTLLATTQFAMAEALAEPPRPAGE